MMFSVNVLVVAQHEVIRIGLGTMLASITEVTDWHTVASVDELDEVGTSAEVTIVVWAMSGVPDDGYPETGDQLRDTRKIVLIPSMDPYYLEMAMAIDASGYMLLGDVTTSSLRASLSQVVNDRMTLPPKVASYLLDRARGTDHVTAFRGVTLTPRERDVINLLIDGLSNRQIASSLGISIHGAKRHVSSILNKFNSPSRAHLVSIALQSGMVRRLEFR